VGVLVRTAGMKTPICLLSTFFLCGRGWADVEERFHIVDGRELNLRSSCSSLMQHNRFFCLISKPFKRNAPTTVTEVCEISPKK